MKFTQSAVSTIVAILLVGDAAAYRLPARAAQAEENPSPDITTVIVDSPFTTEAPTPTAPGHGNVDAPNGPPPLSAAPTSEAKVDDAACSSMASSLFGSLFPSEIPPFPSNGGKPDKSATHHITSFPTGLPRPSGGRHTHPTPTGENAAKITEFFSMCGGKGKGHKGHKGHGKHRGPYRGTRPTQAPAVAA
ncbi:hypothetical protein B0H66DRAFT_632288 [Apodospora peruviana]|uniref:Uncharacterized protein n=1 Tax=Apodospora peruviana TaxID=516989 RepID=A0AAE0LZB1_9PEZI|nr:hypothetical protein B0H66DRAFT_632288 [Apodospora peruviana]